MFIFERVSLGKGVSHSPKSTFQGRDKGSPRVGHFCGCGNSGGKGEEGGFFLQIQLRRAETFPWGDTSFSPADPPRGWGCEGVNGKKHQPKNQPI